MIKTDAMIASPKRDPKVVDSKNTGMFLKDTGFWPFCRAGFKSDASGGGSLSAERCEVFSEEMSFQFTLGVTLQSWPRWKGQPIVWEPGGRGVKTEWSHDRLAAGESAQTRCILHHGSNDFWIYWTFLQQASDFSLYPAGLDSFPEALLLSSGERGVCVNRE